MPDHETERAVATASTSSEANQRPPAIQVEGICKRFGGVHALRDVSLDAKRGEIVGLVGHNGAGKTTLIRILTGDLRPDAGDILMDGEHVVFASVRDAMARGVGVVRQDLNLVPELSLAENLFLGSESAFVKRGMLDRRVMGRAARPLLDRVGIGQAPTTRLGNLPVGDQQLVAAARALRSAGHVLFLDEPTSSLSPWEAERLFTQMRQLAAQGVAIVYISHRIDEVAAICNRVIVLRDGMMAGSFDEPADKMATSIPWRQAASRRVFIPPGRAGRFSSRFVG
jgi:ribose transport system ATP-binding protein